jgi:hypothetical protein
MSQTIGLRKIIVEPLCPPFLRFPIDLKVRSVSLGGRSNQFYHLLLKLKKRRTLKGINPFKTLSSVHFPPSLSLSFTNTPRI